MKSIALVAVLILLVPAMTLGQEADSGKEKTTKPDDSAEVEKLMATCVENSPERRGEVGCSIIENKLLPDGLKEPLFWHIDRFDSAEHARKAVGPASVAFEADGTSWLMTLESQTSDHHGGRHV